MNKRMSKKVVRQSVKVGDLVKLKNPPPSGDWSDPNKLYLVTSITLNTARVYGKEGGRFQTDYEVISEAG